MTEPEKNSEITSAAEEMAGAEASAPVSDGLHSVGAQLANARKQHGWAVEDVASQLKLAPRQIDAIEQDNYNALPTMVMTRGYIRSYAKLLGLDPAAILPSTASATDTAGAFSSSQHGGNTSRSLAQSNIPFESEGRISVKWIVVGVAVVLAAIAATQFGGLSALHSSSVASAESVESASTDKDATGKTDDEILANANTPPSAVASNPQATVAVGATGVPAPTVAPGADNNQLSLHFKQDSWIQVKSADKKILFSGIAKADATETFSLDQPLSVVIGNISGVDATLRGEALDLKANSKTNVARLNLK
ncbi:helix-turn-helix domain-containing protein [Glaciimonas soli]|nr:helix-turn-helix domain-containing protein [Glaciimonas soli]